MGRARRHRARMPALRPLRDAYPDGIRHGRAARRGSWSSGRRPVPRKTGKESHSWAGPGCCSIRCFVPRDSSVATSISQTSSSAGRRTTAIQARKRRSAACRTCAGRSSSSRRRRSFASAASPRSGSSAPSFRSRGLRGRVHELDGVPVIVTYHPAYLLRSPGEKRKSWEDLKIALGVLADGNGA